MKHLILATAGHVDHGKSALVQALTGTDPDRLPEEKARGITIDLGFAELLLAAGEGGEPLHLGIVDVPGHEDFIKNMVAGVGSVDLALLAVAADDRWMPQTEEHLQILTHLGLDRAVVALTKADLASDLPAAISEVRARLRGSPFADAPIVPTSVHDPASLAALQATLASVAAGTRAPRDFGKPRLSVDRAFTLRGVGTVVTGTLCGGTLAAGQHVIIQPAAHPTRIRAVQTHGREVPVAGPGQRVALHLADVAVGVRSEKGGVRRGDVITLPGLGGAREALDVELSVLDREWHVRGAPKLRSVVTVRVHHGSGTAQARLRLLEVDELAAGGRSLARLAFTSPLYAFVGDRFIVRDSTGRHTLAGGVVLDAAPPRELRREQRSFLAARAAARLDLDTLIRTQAARDGATLKAQLLTQAQASASDIAAGIERLAARGELICTGELGADPAWWSALRQRAIASIDAAHRAHPDRVGQDLSEWRSELGDLPAGVADALLGDLLADGFVTVGSSIKRATHRPSLRAKLQAAGARLRAALAAKPLEPPARKELAPDADAWQALRFLMEIGEAVEVAPELVMNATALEQAAARVRQFLKAHTSATTSQLREALGTSRRVIVPLLEKLDRDGVTRRIGDQRVLRSPVNGEADCPPV